MRNALIYDFMIQGMGELMSITGERDDLPGGGPQKAGVAVTDIVTGTLRSRFWRRCRNVCIMAALGQHLDILLDSHVALLAGR